MYSVVDEPTPLVAPYRHPNPLSHDASQESEEGDDRMVELSARDENERRATNLELFLDLAFVYAVANTSDLLEEDLSAAGLGRGLVLSFLVYWLWGQFVWLGTAVDMKSNIRCQMLVLTTVPIILIMSAAIPHAFEDNNKQFAVTYLFAFIWVLLIQGIEMWGSSFQRSAWFHYAPPALITPGVVLLGAYFDGSARVIVWSVAALLQASSAVFALVITGADSAWTIDPPHFVERHALYIIITLGEITEASATGVQKALDANDYDDALTLEMITGVIIPVLVACVIWWTYFSFVSERAEYALRKASTRKHATSLALRLFTFGHFPLVFALLLFAVVTGHVAEAPQDVLSVEYLLAVALSFIILTLGYMNLHYNINKGYRPERIVFIIAVCLITALAGPYISSVVLISILGVLMAFMQLATCYLVPPFVADKACHLKVSEMYRALE